MVIFVAMATTSAQYLLIRVDSPRAVISVASRDDINIGARLANSPEKVPVGATD